MVEALVDSQQVMRSAEVTQADQCIWKELDLLPECAVIRNLQPLGDTTITPTDVQQICSFCLKAVTHFLSTNDLSVCSQFLTWTSTITKACTKSDLIDIPCPDLTSAGCAQLHDLGLLTWKDSKPDVPIPVGTIKVYCDQCVAVMGMDLTPCPAEKAFDKALRAACTLVQASYCFRKEYPKAFPSSPCGATIAAYGMYGAVMPSNVVTTTCGECLPFVQDNYDAWNPQCATTSKRSVVTVAKSQCITGDAKCTADFLLRIPGCEALASILLGLNAFMTQPDCTACLSVAIRQVSNSDRASCATIEATLAQLQVECLAGGFLDIKCSVLYAWLDSNHSYVPPPRNSSSTLSVTLTLPSVTITETISSVPGVLTAAPAVYQPPGPCKDPLSCSCAFAMKDSFYQKWRFYLQKCGTTPVATRIKCTCGMIKTKLYDTVPTCNGVLDRPNLFSLCSDCHPELGLIAPILQDYDTCTKSSVGAATLRGINATCQEGGIGHAICPDAILAAAATQHCEGTFDRLIESSLRSTVVTQTIFRDWVCANSTRCPDNILQNPSLTDSLKTCGIDVGKERAVCLCWPLRKKILATTNCEVLLNDQWKMSELNYSKLCLKCLKDIQIYGSLVSEYGTCMGWGHYYASDLAGNVNTICAQRYLGVGGYVSHSPAVSACHARQDGASSCTPARLCDIERYVPPCSLAYQDRGWRAQGSGNLATVCTSCVIPLLEAFAQNALGVQTPLGGAVVRLQECNAAWGAVELQATCQHSADVCTAYPDGCTSLQVAEGTSGCDVQVLEERGQRWSRCLASTPGDQCSCTRDFLAGMSEGCTNHSILVAWLCTVRQQGCSGVPYPPGVGAAECALLIPTLGYVAGLGIIFATRENRME